MRITVVARQVEPVISGAFAKLNQFSRSLGFKDLLFSLDKSNIR